MDEEPLPLATYATVLAHLVRHRDQPIEKVLAPLGVTLEQLQKADAYFNDRLCESHRLRKGVLAMTFASAFAEARKGALFTAEPVATPILPSSAPAESQALPSYMTAPAPSSASAWSAPPASAPSLPVMVPNIAPSTPAIVSPVTAPPASSAAPQPVRAPSALHQTAPPSTAEVPMMKAPPSAMPFRPSATSSSLSPATPPAASAATPPPGAITASSGGAPLRLGSSTGLGTGTGLGAGTGPSTSAGPGTGTAITSSEGPRLPETPWDQAASRVGKLTLAHYAALTVELSRNPADLTPLYQRYGLSGPDDLRHVQAAFQTQMQFDAPLRAQFEALVGRMRSMSGKRDT